MAALAVMTGTPAMRRQLAHQRAVAAGSSR
jgi:hypothetical protein